MGKVLATTVAAYIVAQLVQSPVNRGMHVNDGTTPGDIVEATVITAVAAVLLWWLVLRPLRISNLRARADVAEREATLRRDASGQEFRARLHRALEMASNESGTYDVVARAMEIVVPDHHSELLLADSSEAHLKVAVDRGSEGSPPGCSVAAPHDCPAVKRAQTATFSDDGELDACPYLQNRSEQPTSAVCVPVSMLGRSIGVLHAVAPIGAHPGPERVSQMEVIADQVGARISMLRVMEQTHLQAATDSLTGLINRRTVENDVRELIHRGGGFCLAMGDLDHFKTLNDTHGHEAGDRALRLFARVMKSSLRQNDLISRFGGEEFVVVLPDLDAEAAVGALQRAQEQLLLALAQGNVAPFTVSFGLAHSDASNSFEELVRLADHALFQAKREGRNRVVLDPSSASPQLSQA